MREEMYDGVPLSERHQGEQPLSNEVVARVNNVEQGLTQLAETGKEGDGPSLAEREERRYQRERKEAENDRRRVHAELWRRFHRQRARQHQELANHHAMKAQRLEESTA